jgi:YhcH/YjgK/YiaL family protein
MILDKLSNWRRYSELTELRAAFEFLEGQIEVCLGSGRVDIDGKRLYAIVQVYDPKPVAECRFESHARYTDIHLVVRGAEMLGHAPLDSLAVETAYDPEKDVAFHPKPKAFTQAALRAGWFAVCYPDDAHMPGCALDSTEPVTKVVVKVRVG